MNNTLRDREYIKNLKDDEVYIVPESDYGKAEIWFKNGRYFLFSIPTYGGEPEFEESYSIHNIDNMIHTYQNWN